VENPLTQPPVVVTTDTATLMRGQTYTVNLSHSVDPVNFPTARNNIRVWIDYNKDFDFVDAGETVITKDLETPGTTYTATFTVPMTAPLGYTRLRATAKMSADAGHTMPTSCDVPADPLDYHGEMEDYTVKIADPTSVNEVNADAAGVAVYPNPTQGSVTVSFSETIQPASIDLYDVTGKHLANIIDKRTLSPTSFTFDLNEYRVPQGVYFIRVRTDNFLSYQKLVKAD
jgi:hemolysin activation/secretion protein